MQVYKPHFEERNLRI